MVARMKTSPKIMGILNVTPDSFSDGGQHDGLSAAVERAKQMIVDGADILDIGGESTRPGAEFVDIDEEIKRTVPVIERIAGLGVPISIDTRKSEVARAAVEAGASIWNDVTALSYDKNSLATAAELGCDVVLMHTQGDPSTMQDKPEYGNVVEEIKAYLLQRIEAVVTAGVERGRITIDPGIGFGKRLDDNLALIHHLDAFHDLGCPILLGTSRKSFIGMINDSEASDRLGGSIASALWGTAMGASVLRVHDVKETAQAVRVWGRVSGGN